MKFFLYGAFLLSSILSFSQITDSFQPDSVYKKNKIKNRISSLFVFCSYDRAGRLIEYSNLTFDNKKVMRIAYSYDSVGRLAHETETSFDNGKEKNVYNSLVEYDKNGMVAKITKFSDDGSIFKEKVITYNPLTETLRIYKKKELMFEGTSYFDVPNLSRRFTGNRIDSDDKIKIKIGSQKAKIKVPTGSWDYIFENKFDKMGKVIERKRFINGELQDQITYVYNDSNLIIETITKINKPNVNPQRERYEYTYWD